MHAIYPDHLILLDLITPIFGDETNYEASHYMVFYRLHNYTLYNTGVLHAHLNLCVIMLATWAESNSKRQSAPWPRGTELTREVCKATSSA
jgi:hypothetical protein